jgi:hypothetical protein
MPGEGSGLGMGGRFNVARAHTVATTLRRLRWIEGVPPSRAMNETWENPASISHPLSSLIVGTRTEW